MIEQIEQITKEIELAVTETKEQLEAFRIRFIGRKSVVTALMGNIKEVAPEQRKEVGQTLNTLKNKAWDKFKALEASLESSNASSAEHGDLTLPPIPNQLGTIHPITQTKNKITQVFRNIGFNVAEGSEIEDDWHNFTALNFPLNHPAREMQDTFFIEKNPDVLLRTHTSNVQIRLMKDQKPPIRSIMPGRVYRNEAISARAHCLFHQVEGLYVNENVSFRDLKNTLYYFAREMFGKDTKVRFRPSFFPFTEPSAEMDIYWGLETEADYRITKGTGWLEILGCGMVDPNVLENCGVDSRKYTGFAFGMGIERIAMLRYKVEDIRLFFENDARFLRQFTALS